MFLVYRVSGLGNGDDTHNQVNLSYYLIILSATTQLFYQPEKGTVLKQFLKFQLAGSGQCDNEIHSTGNVPN